MDTLIDELGQPLGKLTLRAVAHLLLHMIPRPQSGRGDRSPYVDVGIGSTRGNKAEPDMSSPFDYLERDIKLGNRRKGDDRSEFLTERITRVIRVLKYQGNDVPEYVKKCHAEIITRFALNNISLEEITAQANEKLSESLPSERDQIAINIIHDFINANIYMEESN